MEDNNEPAGRAKGGKARAKKLTPERLSEIAKKGANARWGVEARREKAEIDGDISLPKATHGDVSHPLIIGEIEIPCFVLDDGRRVLHQRGMVNALGMARGSSGGTGGDRLAKFVAGDRLKSFVNEHLRMVTSNPIKFRTQSGSLAYGYEATVLADICDAVLAARKLLALQKQQLHIAAQCEILMRGFARVGIVALVDEATGYQYDRPRRDLEDQLKKFISESLRKWVRTFPADYFKHLCRLRGVELRADMKLPQYFGKLTNNLIYRRLAPGLVKRLKEKRTELGSTSNKLHSWLSADVGFPEVLMHLGTVVGLMKLHTDYEKFERQLSEIAPIYPEIPGLFDDPKDWETR